MQKAIGATVVSTSKDIHLPLIESDPTRSRLTACFAPIYGFRIIVDKLFEGLDNTTAIGATNTINWLAQQLNCSENVVD